MVINKLFAGGLVLLFYVLINAIFMNIDLETG